MNEIKRSSGSTNTIDNLSGLQILPPSLKDSIRKIVENEAYTMCDVQTRKLNTGVGNYLSILYEVDIKRETDKGAHEINLFIKQMITLSTVKVVSVKDIFIKEAFFYNEIAKLFVLLQDQAEVPPEDRYKIPKAYAETSSDAIILENLTKRNFKTYDGRKVIPLKYAQLAIKEMAKFHALSLVIENRMPDFFNQNIKSLSQSLWFHEDDDDWKELLQKTCSYIAHLYEDETKSKIENWIPNLLKNFPKHSDCKSSTKCTITHLDYKINNVLVRECNGVPLEVIPVDYQLIGYGCPMRDFMFFIFSGTDQEFRRNHLNNIKELYFEKLSKFLRYFDIDVETVYPRHDFEKDYKESFNYGLMRILFNAIFIFTPDNGLDISNGLGGLSFCPNKEADERLKGLIDDFIQWGYL